jgi:Flp pilus assembly protein TadD
MPAPPRPDDALARAVALLEAGDWPAAHAIVQGDPTDLAAWLHGLVHTLEGDLDNARYWYRRARRAFPGPTAVDRELALARQALETGASRGGEAG